MHHSHTCSRNRSYIMSLSPKIEENGVLNIRIKSLSIDIRHEKNQAIKKKLYDPTLA